MWRITLLNCMWGFDYRPSQETLQRVHGAALPASELLKVIRLLETGRDPGVL